MNSLTNKIVSNMIVYQHVHITNEKYGDYSAFELQVYSIPTPSNPYLLGLQTMRQFSL